MRKWKIALAAVSAFAAAVSALLIFVAVREHYPQKIWSRLGFAEYISDNRYVYQSWDTCLEQLGYDADAVFIGDSLVNMMNFQRHFPGRKIVNLGCSGDTLLSILQRCGIITHLTPEKIFLEGGVNSLDDLTPEKLAAQYEQLLQTVREQNPSAQLYVHSILPISPSQHSWRLTNDAIRRANALLRPLAQQYGAVYIDLYPLYEKDGVLNPDYTIDGLHLNEQGRALWFKALEPYL